VLHPRQFEVNEAWIAFKLNDVPITTLADGDFNAIALMDAASCFLLSSVFVAATAAEPSKNEARHLLKEAQAHKQQLPGTMFIPKEQSAKVLSMEAKRLGIAVVRVPLNELLPIVQEAKESFSEHFGGGKPH
jgi:hypothetical protein